MFIFPYNVLGAVFRGMGDPKTPLLTVVIACAVNVTGDLLLVAMLHMGPAQPWRLWRRRIWVPVTRPGRKRRFGSA